MAQANNVIMIVGRAGSDPEMKYIDANRVVAKFNVAVNRPTKGPDGNYVTDWFPCEFWNKQAELVGELVKKGALVSVVGSARIDKWENNGEKRSRFLIHGNNFQLLSSKGEMSSVHSGGGASSHSSDAPKADTSDDFMDLEDDIPPF